MTPNQPRTEGFRITGWHVFGALVAFFGAVMVVNVAMVWAALSTFGGVETPSSYRAGLEFSREMDRAAAQKALGWAVTADLTGDAEGRRLLVEVADKTGNAVSGLDTEAVFAHLVDARQDRPAALVETAPGRYEGGVTLPDGVWSLHLDLSRSGEVVYRSRNRLSVR